MFDWRETTLDQVVLLKRGFDLPNRDRAPGHFPIISAGGIVGSHNLGPVEGPGFAIGRATNLGIPTWSETAYWPLNTTLYAANFLGNDPHYLYRLFQVLDLSGYDSGSVQPMLNRNYIAKVKVLIAPKKEQRAIAEVLGALDDKIAANTRLALTSERLASALYDELSRKAPRGVVSITEYIELNPELPRPPETAPIYVDMKRLPTSQMTIDSWTHRSPKSGARFMNGDTLMARITPCLENRKTGFVDFLKDGQIGTGSTEFVVLRTRMAGLARAFSYFTAISRGFRDFAIRHMTGTSGRQRVAAKDLATFTMPRLRPEDLQEFNSIVPTLTEHMGALRDENRTLAELRDTLLPPLMSGRLRVKDAEKTVGDVV